MASPEKIAELLPDTLPEDFNEWDGEAPSPAKPDNLRELWETWESTRPFSETPQPLGQSFDRGTTPASSADKQGVSGSASFARVFVKQPKEFRDGDSEASPKAKPDNLRELWDAWEATRPFSETPQPLGQSFDRGATLASSVGDLDVTGSASAAPDFVKQQKESSGGDSEALPTAKPDNLREWSKASEADRPFSETTKPLGQSVGRGATLASSVDDLDVTGSASATPVIVKEQKESSGGNSEASPTAKPDNLHVLWESPEWWEAWKSAHHSSETVKPPEQPEPEQPEEEETCEDLELDEEERRGKRKFVMVAALTVCLTLLALILMIPLFHNGFRFVEKQFAQPLPEAVNTAMEPLQPKAPAREPLTPGEPPATDNHRPTKRPQ